MADAQTTDILLVANGNEASFIGKICENFSCQLEHLSDIDAVLDSKLDPSLMIVSEFSGTEVGVDELVQLTRQQFPHAFLILIVEKELSKERFAFFSKLGADVVLLKSELGMAKIAFAINQILKASYVPLKSTDLVADFQIPFSIFHLMPYRKKFIPIFRAGGQLSAERLEKLKSSPEFYIQRADVKEYKKFIEATAEKSAKGLATRCRANFLALQAEFTKLVFELTDISNKVSFGDGNELLARCTKLCDDLLSNLAEFPRAWEVINNSAIDEFGSLERAPAVAAFCGMFALLGDFQRVSEMMLVSLLVDVGVTQLSYETSDKLRNDIALKGEELESFRKVPQISLSLALARKLSMPEKLRSILIGVYERADGKGYPNGIHVDKLTLESQMIRFAKEFDSRTLLKMGRLRANPLETLVGILEDKSLNGAFSGEFVKLIKDKILVSEIFKN